MYDSDFGFWGSGVGLVILAFFFVMAVVWFFLPFAVFGIKAKLDALIAENRATKAAIAELTAELRNRPH